MTTTRIYGDSIRQAKCQGRRCYRPIFWAQLVDTGRQMCFDTQPQPIERQASLIGDREIWTVDLDHNHWATCPNADAFRQERSR